jgi:predicted DNA binding protein
VTREESIQFKKESPAVKEAMRKLVELNKKRDGAKLTESKVRLLKKKIFDPNRKTRLKMLAKQFGISEMQLYRIKSGENWGHVKIDD